MQPTFFLGKDSQHNIGRLLGPPGGRLWREALADGSSGPPPRPMVEAEWLTTGRSGCLYPDRRAE
jgi:hypothetical protein